ncbi:MAG: choice-of-anchor E domain-containing protein [Kiritimatiellales bacterium]
MKKNLIIIAALLLVAGTLQAATVTYTNSVAMNHNQDATVSLNMFDSSLGTLTGIYLEYITQLAGANVQLDNDSALAQQGTAAVLNNATALSTSTRITGTGISRFALYIDAQQIFDLGATSEDALGVFNVTAGSDYANWSPGTLSASSGGYVDSSVFSDYIGLGTFTGTVISSFFTSASFNGSDGYFQGNTPNGAFDGKVIYTYSPIPEPATASLMALVAAIGFLIRRRFIA